MSLMLRFRRKVFGESWQSAIRKVIVRVELKVDVLRQGN